MSGSAFVYMYPIHFLAINASKECILTVKTHCLPMYFKQQFLLPAEKNLELEDSGMTFALVYIYSNIFICIPSPHSTQIFISTCHPLQIGWLPLTQAVRFHLQHCHRSPLWYWQNHAVLPKRSCWCSEDEQGKTFVSCYLQCCYPLALCAVGWWVYFLGSLTGWL